MAGKATINNGDGKAVGKSEAERDDEAMDYLLKPSPLFVAGLTLGIAIATATVVAKIRIKQFWAIPLAGKVVAPCPLMAMPLFLFFCEGGADDHARVRFTPRKCVGWDQGQVLATSRSTDHGQKR